MALLVETKTILLWQILFEALERVLNTCQIVLWELFSGPTARLYVLKISVTKLEPEPLRMGSFGSTCRYSNKIGQLLNLNK